VCSQGVEDDGISFLSETSRIERIRDEEAYEGVHCSTGGAAGHCAHSLQTDVGFGDAIVPAPEELGSA
jgi:hypothetical protein